MKNIGLNKLFNILKETYQGIDISDEELFKIANNILSKDTKDKENFIEVELTIEDFFNLNNANTNEFLDIPITMLDDYYVEVPNGKYSRINHLIKKQKEYLLDLILEDGKILTVAENHIFPQLDGTDIFAKEAEYVITKKGVSKIISKFKRDKEEYIYDIGIDNPHLFYDSQGILHHNSALMVSIAANMVINKEKVLYITLEMPEKEINKRFDANILGINMNHLKDTPADEIKSKFEKLKDNIGEVVVKEYGAGTFNVLHLASLLNDLANQENPYEPTVIFIDYLGIAASSRISLAKAGGSYGYVKAIAEEFHAFAKKYDIPVISASQLNRCLTKDSSVDKKVGNKYIKTKLENIKVGDTIKGSLGDTKVKNVVVTDKQNVYRIKLKSGKTIKVSGDHRFPTPYGLISIKEGLQKGFKISSIK